MNTLLQRLRPLDYVLIAALVIVGFMLFGGRAIEGEATNGQSGGSFGPAWEDALGDVARTVREGDVDGARTAFAVAADAARAEGESGTARAIDGIAARLTSLKLDDLDTLFGPALSDENVGPRFLQFLFQVTAGIMLPAFPDGLPPSGNAWGEVLRTTEEDLGTIQWATVTWSAVEGSPLALRADLLVSDTGFTAELEIDFTQPGMFALTIPETPGGGDITGAAPFALASDGAVFAELSDAPLLDGKISGFRNRVTLQLAPGEELDSIRALEAAPELATTVRFDDDSTMLVRFQISSAARDLFRRIRDHVLGGAN